MVDANAEQLAIKAITQHTSLLPPILPLVLLRYSARKRVAEQTSKFEEKHRLKFC